MQISTYIYIHTYIHTYMYIHVHTYIHTCTYWHSLARCCRYFSLSLVTQQGPRETETSKPMPYHILHKECLRKIFALFWEHGWWGHYDSQLKYTIQFVMLVGHATWFYISILSPKFHQIQQICYTYNSLRCLDLQIWSFLCIVHKDNNNDTTDYFAHVHGVNIALLWSQECRKFFLGETFSMV